MTVDERGRSLAGNQFLRTCFGEILFRARSTERLSLPRKYGGKGSKQKNQRPLPRFQPPSPAISLQFSPIQVTKNRPSRSRSRIFNDRTRVLILWLINSRVWRWRVTSDISLVKVTLVLVRYILKYTCVCVCVYSRAMNQLK